MQMRQGKNDVHKLPESKKYNIYVFLETSLNKYKYCSKSIFYKTQHCVAIVTGAHLMICLYNSLIVYNIIITVINNNIHTTEFFYIKQRGGLSILMTCAGERYRT